jgi:hypothetical protein
MASLLDALVSVKRGYSLPNSAAVSPHQQTWAAPLIRATVAVMANTTAGSELK